jgi:hypothetical protein
VIQRSLPVASLGKPVSGGHALSLA